MKNRVILAVLITAASALAIPLATQAGADGGPCPVTRTGDPAVCVPECPTLRTNPPVCEPEPTIPEPTVPPTDPEPTVPPGPEEPQPTVPSKPTTPVKPQPEPEPRQDPAPVLPPAQRIDRPLPATPRVATPAAPIQGEAKLAG